ncbi:MAG: class I SAM-dependent methyltransferase [Solirubrobacteraceae bacterium]
MSASQPARERWNERYSRAGFRPLAAHPAEWLVEHRALLEEVRDGARRPRALDVACGDGSDARLLAEIGFEVVALDLSDVAVEAVRSAAGERGLRIDARVSNLERDPLPRGGHDVVICMSYLQRDLFAALADALRPGGLLLYETFARAHVDELGRPFNPDYVLGRNELLGAFARLHVRHYREGIVSRRGESRGVASLVAQRLA